MGQAIRKNKKLQKTNKKVEIVDYFQEISSVKDVPVEGLIQENLSLSQKRDQYFANVKKAESWMREKMPIVKIYDYGNDENRALALHKHNELFIYELEGFHETIQELKLQSSHISDLESQKSLEGSQDSLELENVSTTVIQNQMEAQYNDLLRLAKNRQTKLNETTKTYILLREAHEHAINIEKTTKSSEMEFLKVNKKMDQIEFMANYDNFQINMRTNEVRLYSMNQIITEIAQLGKNEEVEKINICYQGLNERWSQILKKFEPTYEKHRFFRDVDEINGLIRDKLSKMNEMISIGHDLKTVKALQKKQENFERELDIVTEKVRLLNKRQKRCMQTNSEVVIETYSKLEEINKDWNNLIEGMTAWKTKLYICYEIYKSLFICHEMMERLSIRLPRSADEDYNADRNNNI